MSSVQPFEPAKFLTRVNGSEYLECKWRLVWLRDQHPDAAIETELVSHDVQQASAIFKATVTLPDGKGRATGYGSQTRQDFRDYIEKSETKAIGRALAALGFGTQFCSDHDFGVAQGRVVDAPVKVANFSRSTNANEARPTSVAAPAAQEPASQRQLRYMQAVAREAGFDAQALDELAQREFDAPAMALSRRDASAVIDIIQNQQTEVPLESNAPASLSERVRNGRDSAPPQNAPQNGSKPAATPGQPPTQKQWDYLERLRGELNLERPQISEFFTLRYGYDIDSADRADLSNLIDALKGVIDGSHALESILERIAPLATVASPNPQGDYAEVPWDDLPPVKAPF